MHLFERCLAARQRAKLSQEALALELGVSRGAVAQWEMRTGTVPTVENMIALAKRTGVAFEWLATDRGPMALGEPKVSEPMAEYLPLSDQERQMLALFRQSTAKRRHAVIDMLMPS